MVLLRVPLWDYRGVPVLCGAEEQTPGLLHTRRALDEEWQPSPKGSDSVPLLTESD